MSPLDEMTRLGAATVALASIFCAVACDGASDFDDHAAFDRTLARDRPTDTVAAQSSALQFFINRHGRPGTETGSIDQPVACTVVGPPGPLTDRAPPTAIGGGPQSHTAACDRCDRSGADCRNETGAAMGEELARWRSRR